MVKEQNLALNPTKISGICGRLMCCMFYEHSTYSELWKTLPTPGAKIKTPQGNYVLEGVDLRTETVKVSFPEGGDATIPVAEFPRFKETIMRGETWPKEEKKDTVDPYRKPILPRGRMSRIAFDTPGGSAHNSNKSRPEKISIEEHITERISAEKAAHHTQPFQGQAPKNSFKAEGPATSKKRLRKRKDASLDSRNQEEQVRAQGTRERPPEQRSKNDPAEGDRRNAQSETQASSTDTRGVNFRGSDSRRRPRHKSGNRGHERPAAGNTGAAAEKEDS